MSNSNALYVRMDAQLKDSAEDILKGLGISASSAVQMFYRQIILQRGLPFEVKLPPSIPVAIGGMSREELDAELQRGVDSLKSGKRYSADEVDRHMAEVLDA